MEKKKQRKNINDQGGFTNMYLHENVFKFFTVPKGVFFSVKTLQQS